MAAAKELVKGNWQLALDHVFSIEVWNKLNKLDSIKATLTE